jgi:demethylmenaquinone methyltransferase/2-methoxy-6-polyprenyl-1,4-benzoquinol methylase
MLRLASQKGRAPAGAGPTPVWIAGDATALPLPDACVDVVSIAFGIRNVDRPERALAEFARVLRPGGRLIVLEFSLPRWAPLRWLYNLYFRHVLPRTASWIAHDRSGAYHYLPQSVNTYIGRERMAAMLVESGFEGVRAHPLTLGVAVVYRGVRTG